MRMSRIHRMDRREVAFMSLTEEQGAALDIARAMVSGARLWGPDSYSHNVDTCEFCGLQGQRTAMRDLFMNDINSAAGGATWAHLFVRASYALENGHLQMVLLCDAVSHWRRMWERMDRVAEEAQERIATLVDENEHLRLVADTLATRLADAQTREETLSRSLALSLDQTRRLREAVDYLCERQQTGVVDAQDAVDRWASRRPSPIQTNLQPEVMERQETMYDFPSVAVEQPETPRTEPGAVRTFNEQQEVVSDQESDAPSEYFELTRQELLNLVYPGVGLFLGAHGLAPPHAASVPGPHVAFPTPDTILQRQRDYATEYLRGREAHRASVSQEDLLFWTDLHFHWTRSRNFETFVSHQAAPWYRIHHMDLPDGRRRFANPDGYVAYVNPMFYNGDVYEFASDMWTLAPSEDEAYRFINFNPYEALVRSRREVVFTQLTALSYNYDVPRAEARRIDSTYRERLVIDAREAEYQARQVVWPDPSQEEEWDEDWALQAGVTAMSRDEHEEVDPIVIDPPTPRAPVKPTVEVFPDSHFQDARDHRTWREYTRDKFDEARYRWFHSKLSCLYCACCVVGVLGYGTIAFPYAAGGWVGLRVYGITRGLLRDPAPLIALRTALSRPWQLIIHPLNTLKRAYAAAKFSTMMRRAWQLVPTWDATKREVERLSRELPPKFAKYVDMYRIRAAAGNKLPITEFLLFTAMCNLPRLRQDKKIITFMMRYGFPILDEKEALMFSAFLLSECGMLTWSKSYADIFQAMYCVALQTFLNGCEYNEYERCNMVSRLSHTMPDFIVSVHRGTGMFVVGSKFATSTRAMALSVFLDILVENHLAHVLHQFGAFSLEAFVDGVTPQPQRFPYLFPCSVAASTICACGDCKSMSCTAQARVAVVRLQDNSHALLLPHDVVNFALGRDKETSRDRSYRASCKAPMLRVTFGNREQTHTVEHRVAHVETSPLPVSKLCVGFCIVPLTEEDMLSIKIKFGTLRKSEYFAPFIYSGTSDLRNEALMFAGFQDGRRVMEASTSCSVTGQLYNHNINTQEHDCGSLFLKEGKVVGIHVATRKSLKENYFLRVREPPRHSYSLEARVGDSLPTIVVTRLQDCASDDDDDCDGPNTRVVRVMRQSSVPAPEATLEVKMRLPVTVAQTHVVDESVTLEAGVDEIVEEHLTMLQEVAANGRVAFDALYVNVGVDVHARPLPPGRHKILHSDPNNKFVSLPLPPELVYSEMAGYHLVKPDVDWAQSVRALRLQLVQKAKDKLGLTRKIYDFNNISSDDFKLLVKLCATEGSCGEYRTLFGAPKSVKMKRQLYNFMRGAHFDMLLHDVRALFVQDSVAPLRPFLKDEPYKKKKVDEGRLRSIIALPWALSILTCSLHVYVDKDGALHTLDDVLSKLALKNDPVFQTGVGVAIPEQLKRKFGPAWGVAAFDVKGWDKKIPVDVMRALYDNSDANFECVSRHLFLKQVFALEGQLYRRREGSIWPSGAPHTLSGNSLFHLAVLHATDKAHSWWQQTVMVQGDDMICTTAVARKVAVAYANRGLEALPENPVTFCGLRVTPKGLELDVEKIEDKMSAHYPANRPLDPVHQAALQAAQDYIRRVNAMSEQEIEKKLGARFEEMELEGRKHKMFKNFHKHVMKNNNQSSGNKPEDMYHPDNDEDDREDMYGDDPAVRRAREEEDEVNRRNEMMDWMQGDRH